jgi:hypothetical protein
MLSPNARNFVTSSRGGAETLTLKLQEAFCPPTLALHVTVVEPTGNVEPLAGVQALVRPGPPAATTGGYDTGIGPPFGEMMLIEDGHIMAGLGVAGFEQPATAIAITPARALFTMPQYVVSGFSRTRRRSA